MTKQEKGQQWGWGQQRPGKPYPQGKSVPQHELLSRKTWAFILSGKVRQWTYWATTTNTVENVRHDRHDHSVTIYPEDYQNQEGPIP